MNDFIYVSASICCESHGHRKLSAGVVELPQLVAGDCVKSRGNRLIKESLTIDEVYSQSMANFMDNGSIEVILMCLTKCCSIDKAALKRIGDAGEFDVVKWTGVKEPSSTAAIVIQCDGRLYRALIHINKDPTSSSAGSRRKGCGSDKKIEGVVPEINCCRVTIVVVVEVKKNCFPVSDRSINKRTRNRGVLTVSKIKPIVCKIRILPNDRKQITSL